MPTAPFSTDPHPTVPLPTQLPGPVAAARRAVADVRHLLWFRSATVRRRAVAGWAVLTFVLVTSGAAVIPAYLDGAGDLAGSGRASEFLVVLPTLLAGVLGLAIVSGVASGGGRELLSKENGIAYPVSPTTDHLGALLLAPLNISWLLQAWLLLGIGAYALGPQHLALVQLIALLWIVAATAIAQVVAWTFETIRRGPHGVAIVRGVMIAAGAAGVWLQLSGNLAAALDKVPTSHVMFGMLAAREGTWVRFVVTLAVLLALVVVAVALGAIPAHLAARRTPRDELRVETGVRPARRDTGSDLMALVRIDRGSIWRSVPMRRGLMVLAIGPGLVALAGNLEWNAMTILPGLVASGAALLFGVNVWCLDGRGALWRESLPSGPRTVFTARVLVLSEWLLVASGVTLVLASLRAGLPQPHELSALLATLVVVTVQVVSGSMRWSAKRPFSVDMRSARATPAPPVVMLGYSARLALSTTMTGLVFSGLARLPYWSLSIAMAIPFIAWSLGRLLFAQQAWVNPFQRARIVMTVAA
ncbi:hypothetical protein [Nocardioides sp.]|uniref:hypothetical protein n=1 Tax=Nocardioides sp. TaxID=35761 RepID=UPI003527DC53